MRVWLPRLILTTVCASLLAVACGALRRGERPVRSKTPSATIQAPRPVDELYAADEALRDALSGTWQYVGTGAWPGNNRMQACAFRNERVLIVNVYCSLSETQAFRLEVYSPVRGRVRIYAEAGGPVSQRTRQQYFTFTAESEPPPTHAAQLPVLALSMTFAELSAYDDQRYRAALPGCFGGQERQQDRSGCLGTLAPRAAVWSARNQTFLQNANADWYQVVHELRALASRYGAQPR